MKSPVQLGDFYRDRTLSLAWQESTADGMLF
jgi:hypothetical protein